MGTEFFIVNPTKKQIIGVGRYCTYLDSIPNWCYKQCAGKCTKTVKGFFKDWWENNRQFFYGDTPKEVLKEFIELVYKFVEGEEVYLDSDVSGNTEWQDYEEVYGYYEFFADKSKGD